MLPRLRRTPALGSVLAHHAGRQQSTVLEMVCRRQNQRLLQLRRPPSRAIQKQSGADFCSGAGTKIRDRKSTRLNSSHANISYAVFCLKKKKKKRCVQSWKLSNSSL